MKANYRNIGLMRLCRLLGVTRQSYYQHFWNKENIQVEQELIVKEVIKIRQYHRHMGGRKLYEKLSPFLLEHQIKMGRDAFFDVLSSHCLLVRKKKRKIHTTQSFHWLRKYRNLIKGYLPTGSNQLWVSDITYWKIKHDYLYISFITDAYSHKIVGYNVASTLEAIESVSALKMALQSHAVTTNQLIHHSDRGIQYCSEEYTRLLQENGIQISMTETGDPPDNALAERVNGIIKNEYLCDYKIKNLQQAKEVLAFVIELYNRHRPHMSNGNLTPDIIHNNNLKTKKLWKNYPSNKPQPVNLLQDKEIKVNS
jgi:putative transposase